MRRCERTRVTSPALATSRRRAPLSASSARLAPSAASSRRARSAAPPILFDRDDPREDARDVPTAERRARPERDARPRARGIAPDALDLGEPLGARRKRAAAIARDLLRGGMEHPRAAVVAEAAPH